MQYPYGGYSGPYPYGGYPQAYPAASYGVAGYGYGLPRPVAVAQVADTPFAVALVEVRGTPNGPAAASLVAGIASVLVSLVVVWFALLWADAGWGPKVAGAFAVLATALFGAAAGLARGGLRRIRTSPAWGPAGGRGVAIAGLTCGIAGLGISALVMAAALTA